MRRLIRSLYLLAHRQLSPAHDKPAEQRLLSSGIKSIRKHQRRVQGAMIQPTVILLRRLFFWCQAMRSVYFESSLSIAGAPVIHRSVHVQLACHCFAAGDPARTLIRAYGSCQDPLPPVCLQCALMKAPSHPSYLHFVKSLRFMSS